MSALPKPLSLDDFIAWEERQDLRYEYDGLVIEAMTGGSIPHGRIQANVIIALGERLRGGPCFVLGSEVKVRTESSIRYPDAMVLCGTSETPTIIFEILSPSTARKDLGAKNTEYQTLESLRRYVVLHQDAQAAHVFFRDPENEWGYEFLTAKSLLKLPEISVEMPLSLCYEGLAPH